LIKEEEKKIWKAEFEQKEKLYYEIVAKKMLN